MKNENVNDYKNEELGEETGGAHGRVWFPWSILVVIG